MVIVFGIILCNPKAFLAAFSVFAMGHRKINRANPAPGKDAMFSKASA
jgi:hypothetical protein